MIWQPAVMARGRMTAQSQACICQPEGIAGVAKTIIIAMSNMQMTSAIQKRLRILGTSSQKLERSTSFLVAPQVMLYEKRCARRACERWMERPPKKKKLCAR